MCFPTQFKNPPSLQRSKIHAEQATISIQLPLGKNSISLTFAPYNQVGVQKFDLVSTPQPNQQSDCAWYEVLMS
jgi:hypothetical protein